MGLIARIRNELVTIRSLRRTLKRVEHVTPESGQNVADTLEAVAQRFPDNVAFHFEDRTITYREWSERSNRYARWVRAQGVRPGDCVALMMENRPEFLVAWLGILKVRAIAGLVNTHLKAHPLAHSIQSANAKILVLGAELAEPWASAADLMTAPPVVWVSGGKVPGTNDLDAALDGHDAGPLPAEWRAGVKTTDTAFYIYTSGTTGNPKAALISHLRALTMMHAFSAAVGATPADRMYDALPLYHTAGGICAPGATLTVGGSLIIRRRFSASQFWDDCRKYRATMFQYIGELCRYLLHQPPRPDDGRHAVRICIGNGLRPDIWEPFRTRFAIPKIVEFYGATEGNIALLNYDGTVGSVGRIPRWLEKRFAVKIVRFDVEAEQPVRGPDGFCVECPPGEVGEVIGRISEDRSRPTGRFEGYTDAKDTEKKVLRDVFEKGDRWFRSGDLMKKDARGYFYFIDRIGDTFRWKGENVATSEVAEVLSVFDGVREANVYGVKVPGADGRAGMAAVVTNGDIDLARLRQHVERELPEYARPLFLRLRSQIDVTGTFKHRKVDLVREGFDPGAVPDPLYFNDSERGYVPLDQALFDRICNGGLRL